MPSLAGNFLKLLNWVFTFNNTDHSGSKGSPQLIIPRAAQSKLAEESTEVTGKIKSQSEGNGESKAWADIRVYV